MSYVPLTDPITDLLLRPFEIQPVGWPSGGDLPLPRVAVLNAQAGGAYARIRGDVVFQQFSRPVCAVLEAAGFAAVPEWPEEGYDIVLICVPRQREEARALIARGVRGLAAAGWLVCAAANESGGKRLEKIIRETGLSPTSETRRHARVVWAQKTASVHDSVLESWIADGDFQRVTPEQGTVQADQATQEEPFLSCPGLFSWDRMDTGSACLAAFVPEDLKGRGADFGCGAGLLARAVLQACPALACLTAIDSDARALTCARENLSAFADRTDFLWADLAACPPPLGTSLDWIVMNPPFHAARTPDPDLGRAFIRNAALSLSSGGVLYMVANAHLPYEQDLKSHFQSGQKCFEAHGYKVYRAVR